MQKINIMGLDLTNPLIIASGPWSRGKLLKNALECNAGAIITETIVSESYPDTRPRYAYHKITHGMQNIRRYTALELENWLNELEYINKEKRYGSTSKLIVSIMGSSPSELRYIAKKIEKTGIDAIEIGLACTIGEGAEIVSEDPKRVYEYTKEVVDTVDIPVSVKIGATGNLPSIVKSIEKAGASGISAIDTVRCILSINTETGKPDLPTYGGYSGPPIRPIGLATVAGIVQSTNLPVIGIGGIENHINMLEYIMAGASACGIGTEILLRGYGVIGEIQRDLEQWLSSHNIKNINQIRGTALRELKSFEEIKMEMKQAVLSSPCDNQECSKCINCCLKNATRFENNLIRIDPHICDGCGLCLSICPDKKIKLSWNF